MNAFKSAGCLVTVGEPQRYFGNSESARAGLLPEVILQNEKFNTVHSILLATKAFTLSTIEREVQHDAVHYEFRRRPNYVWSLLQHGLTMLEQGQVARGFSSLQKGCSVVEKNFRQLPGNVILSLFVVMGNARWGRHESLRRELLHFLALMSSSVLGKQHPLTHILQRTGSIDLMSLSAESALRVVLECTEERLSAAHPEVLSIKQSLCIQMMRTKDYHGSERLIRDAWNASSFHNGPCSRLTRRTMRRLGNNCIQLKRLAEAEAIFEDVVWRDGSGSGSLDEISIITCENLSMVCAMQGQDIKSEYWADRQLEMALQRWGPEDPFYKDICERREARRHGAPIMQWFSWLEIT